MHKLALSNSVLSVTSLCKKYKDTWPEKGLLGKVAANKQSIEQLTSKPITGSWLSNDGALHKRWRKKQ